MSRHILVSPDPNVRERWLQAFTEAEAVDDLAAVNANAANGLVTWLHLPADAEAARELVRVATHRLPGARLVAMSDMPDDELALELMENGASAYCHSHAGAAMLTQVATVVENRGLWVGPRLLSRLIRAAIAANLPQDTAANPALAQLSAREREVALAVGSGSSNKEIARQLDITERTVKAHLSAIFMKLGVRDRVHLALLVSGAAAGSAN